MKNKIDLGGNIRKARGVRRMNVHKLSKLSGIGENTIFDIEAGKRNPTWETLVAIADALDCCVAYLVREEWV